VTGASLHRKAFVIDLNNATTNAATATIGF